MTETTEYTDDDMAAVGRATMAAIKANANIGWTPADCPSEIVGDLRNERDELAAEIADLRAALKWYADGEHFARTDPDAWDTVSGEPQNWWCDDAGAGMVEDGTLAGKVLAGELTGAQLLALDDEDEGPQSDVAAANGGLS